MPDVEKVIKGLEQCKEGGSCDGCQYDIQSSKCIFLLHADTLALLKEQETEIQNLRRENHDILTKFHEWAKEQEAVEPVLDEQTGRIWLCGKCGSYVGFEDNDPHDPNEFDKYCRDCGTPVLWEGR